MELREAGLGTGGPSGGPIPKSRSSPARCTSPRPGRSGGSPGPAARAPPAAGTRPPPSSPGCTSRPARCTPAPAGTERGGQRWPAAPGPQPLGPALPTPSLPGPVLPPPSRTHLLQPSHGISHLRVPQPVLRQVADDLREEGVELLALGRCPSPGPAAAAAHGAGSRSRRCCPRPSRLRRPRPAPPSARGTSGRAVPRRGRGPCQHGCWTTTPSVPCAWGGSGGRTAGAAPIGPFYHARMSPRRLSQ